MFYKKNTVAMTSHAILLNYYNTGQCILFIDLFIINTSQFIYFFNTYTRLMIKKINKKYTLTCISIKKKYTLTCINDKKGQ